MNMRNPETATPVEAPDTTIKGGVHAALAHESGAKHVTGAAEYIDDIPEPAGLLHACLGLSDRAHAERRSRMDLGAVAAAPGVIGRSTAADIPGPQRREPGQPPRDDPVFAVGTTCSYHGQPMFAVVAETRDAARRAAAAGAGGLRRPAPRDRRRRRLARPTTRWWSTR